MFSIICCTLRPASSLDWSVPHTDTSSAKRADKTSSGMTEVRGSIKNRKRSGASTDPCGTPCLMVLCLLRELANRKNSVLSVLEETSNPAQELPRDSLLQHGKQQVLPPHSVIRPREVDQGHDCSFRLLLLKAVAHGLRQPDHLIFTASTSAEPSLTVAKPVVRLCQVADSSCNHAFQSLDDAGGQADWSEGGDFATGLAGFVLPTATLAALLRISLNVFTLRHSLSEVENSFARRSTSLLKTAQSTPLLFHRGRAAPGFVALTSHSNSIVIGRWPIPCLLPRSSTLCWPPRKAPQKGPGCSQLLWLCWCTCSSRRCCRCDRCPLSTLQFFLHGCHSAVQCPRALNAR